MDIMLHLGAHRCASTSFQNYVWGNRVRLAKQGLTAWTPRRTRDGLLAGLMRDPLKITIEDERKAIRSIGRIRVEIDRLERAGQNGLLISEENLLGSMRTNVAQTGLYHLLDERLMRFRPAFEGRSLRIGLCIRSYEDVWASSLSSLIMRGAALPSVDTLDFLTTQPRRWRTVVRDVAAAFPGAKIVVWPFERMAGRADAQLGALWGGDRTGLENSDAWHNRSATLRQLGDMMALRGERPIVDGPIDSSARWMPFDEDQRNVLRAEYRSDLAWLRGGAQGLAEFVDEAFAPAESIGDAGATRALFVRHRQNSGQHMSANWPDRADMTTLHTKDAATSRGRHDGIEERLGGIEERLGRAGAS